MAFHHNKRSVQLSVSPEVRAETGLSNVIYLTDKSELSACFAADVVCDGVLRLAMQIFHASSSAVSFIGHDGERHIFAVGPIPSGDRADSILPFMDHVSDQALIIPDITATGVTQVEGAASDVLFHFFTGVPLRSIDGRISGALCVMDASPKHPSHDKINALGVLAGQLTRLIEYSHLDEIAHKELEDRLRAEAAQRESEAKFHAIIESSNVAYALLRDSKFEYLNQRFIDSFGYTIDEIPTLEDWWLLAYPDPEYRDQVLQDTARLVTKCTVDGLPFEDMEVRIRCKDGSDCTVIAGARPLGTGSSKHFVVSFYDISDRKRIEVEKEKLLSEAQDKADRDPLTGLLNHRAFYNKLDIEALRADLEERRLAIIMLDLDNFKFFNDAYGHAIGDEVLQMVANQLRDVCRTYDSCGRFGGDEFAVLMPNVSEVEAEDIESRLRFEFKGLFYHVKEIDASIPVSISLGCAIYPDASGDIRSALQRADERLRWSKTGGDVEAYAQRVRQDVGSRVSGFSMLDALVTAVDNKDRYTRRHSEDVMEHTLTIYRELGLDEKAQQTAAIAALLHDVGKIGVPDAILRKPGPLNEHEFEAVRQHPQMGAVIVGAVSGLEDTLDAVRHHHERWDGRGYPSGLVGKQTPLIARVMAVADAFSAMTTDRPYRKAMEENDALAILVSGSGKQWDPECVNAFVKSRTAGL